MLGLVIGEVDEGTGHDMTGMAYEIVASHS